MRLYRLVDNGRKLELVHKTAVGGIPGALAAFKGRLLAGVGPIVRLYDLGKKKLLRKSEYRRYSCFFVPVLHNTRDGTLHLHRRCAPCNTPAGAATAPSVSSTCCLMHCTSAVAQSFKRRMVHSPRI